MTTSITQAAKVQEVHDQWTVMFPVQGLYLTPAIKREYKINDVLFIDREKLIKCAEKLRVPQKVFKIKSEARFFRDAFEDVRTYALVRRTGTPDELTRPTIELGEEALSILAASQLGYGRRNSNARLSFTSSTAAETLEQFFFAPNQQLSLGKGAKRHPYSRMTLDDRWLQYNKHGFFTKLVTIMHDEQAARGWRNLIRRVLALIGESQNERTPHKALVWSWCALEALLLGETNKQIENLIERIEALIGWIKLWNDRSYKKLLNDIYSKRNKLMHQGQRDIITMQDVLFLDEILLNVLVNIASHPKIFREQNDIINFAARVRAEHLLGIKPKVRPKTMSYIARHHMDEDYIPLI